MEKTVFTPQNHSLHPLRMVLLRQKEELLLALALNHKRLAGPEARNADSDGTFRSASAAMRVNRVLSGKLSRIEEALERMNSGCFGVCVLCGETVARYRLQSVPWERYCTACRENRNSRFTDSSVEPAVLLEEAAKLA